MKIYFLLQFKIAKRKLIDFGIHPYLAFSLAIIAFSILSYIVYQRTELAPYILMAVSLVISISWDSIDKIDFLRQNFGSESVFKIRLFEHLISSIPFLLVFMICGDFIPAIILILLVLLKVKFLKPSTLVFKLNSPYQKFPFEFTIGFRKNIVFMLIALAISIIGCFVRNYNIAIFGVMIITFAMMNFYAYPEARLILWEDVRNEKVFLWYKLRVAFRYYLWTILPFLIMIIISYPAYWVYTLLWFGLSLYYLLFFVLMKYDAYPNYMSLPHTIYFIICLIIPPVSLIFAYRFYRNSLINIKNSLR